MKYRLKLTRQQKRKLNLYNHHYRYSYNKAIGFINDENNLDNCKIPNPFSCYENSIEQKANNKIMYSENTLRNMIVPKKVNAFSEWINETPSPIRARAVFEAYEKYTTCLSLLKNGNIKHFKLKYKTRKKQKRKWTINISKEDLKVKMCDKHAKVAKKDTYSKDICTCEFIKNNNFEIYPRQGLGWIRTTENMKIDITKMDCKIHFDGLHYYLLAPYETSMRKNQGNSWECSIDPGVRKFQTLYAPDDNKNIIIGENASKNIVSYLYKLDKLMSENGPGKEKIKILNKVQDLQSELHRKVSRFLCNNFNVINIPRLTKNNDIIKNTNLRSKTVRQMVILGHSKFLELLKTKAEEYENVQVTEVSEEYTSQECLRCHKRTKTKNEIYKCSFCKYEIDRDIMGSINIYEKFCK